MTGNATPQAQEQVHVAKWIFRRYARQTFWITFSIMTLVVLYSLFMTPVYKGTSSILIDNKATTVLSDIQQTLEFNRDLALAQKALALSNAVLQRAGEIAGIVSWKLPDADQEPLAPLGEKVINAKVEGQLLTLEVLNTDCWRAVKLANAWMRAFAEAMGNRQRAASAYASSYLDNRLPKARQEWIARQTALQDFLLETNFDRKEAEYHPIYKQYIDLNSKITQCRIELSALKSEAAAWAGNQSKLEALFQLPRARIDANILAYEKLIQDKNREVVELRQNFDANGDKVQRAQAALAELETLCRRELQRIGDQIKLELSIAESSLADMSTIFEGFKTEYLKVKSNEAKYQTLSSDAQLAQTQYEDLLKRQQEAAVEGSASYSYAQPFERAELPLKKYRPNWLLNTALGLFLSMFLSGSVIGVCELLNERIRTATEIKRLGLPLWVEIPLMGKSEARDAMSLISAHPHSAPAQALRMLRSHLLAARLCARQTDGANTSVPHARAENSRVVMVTSPGCGEGKSFIAANLADLLASVRRQKDNEMSRVLLVDANPNSGPRDSRERAASVDTITAGAAAESGSEVLQSPVFAARIEEARRQYDFIVIDAPPVLCGSAVLEMCDATLAVVRSRATKASDVQRLAEALSNAADTSWVLNAVNEVDAENTSAAAPAARPKPLAIFQGRPQTKAAVAHS